MVVHFLTSDNKVLCGAKVAERGMTRSVSCVSCTACGRQLSSSGVGTSGSGQRRSRPQGTNKTPKGALDPQLLATFAAAGFKYSGKWDPEGDFDFFDIFSEIEFSKKRKFRLDFGVPIQHIAIEIHGGARTIRASGHMGGAHHSKEGRKRDMVKARLANAEGWIYGEFDYADIKDGSLLDWLLEVKKER